MKLDGRVVKKVAIVPVTQEILDLCHSDRWVSRTAATVSTGKLISLIDRFKYQSSDLEAASKQMHAQLLELYPHTVIYRSELSLIKVGSKMGKHYDARVFHSLAHRVHVPIITSPGTSWAIWWRPDEIYDVKMGKGEVWELNNRVPHAVGNKQVEGSIDRVHLLVDLISDSYGSADVEHLRTYADVPEIPREELPDQSSVVRLSTPSELQYAASLGGEKV